MKVSKSSRLRITTPDKAGELAKVLGIVADAGVNGLAYAGYSRDGKGHIMLVTADNAKAAGLLKKAGYEVKESPVALVMDADKKGNAVAMARKLAAAGVNLTGAYATAAGGEYLSVLEAADVDKLIAALK